MTPEAAAAKIARDRAWHLANRDRRLAGQRLRAYGITASAYAALIARQGGLCAICHVVFDDAGDRSHRICVDHDHETGENRGLLCHNSNVGLGHLGDGDIPRISSAIAYLLGGYAR